MTGFKFAVRQLTKSPGFTVTAVITLALGIGATTATVSAVRSTLFAPIPVEHPERLVSVNVRYPAEGGRSGLNLVEARDIESASDFFERVVMWNSETLTLEEGGLPTLGTAVSRGFFRMFGAQPLLGRLPDETDFAADAAPTVLISQTAWETVFDSDPSIIGRPMSLEESTVTVIGVMPRYFSFPQSNPSYWRTGPDAIADLNIELLAELRAGVTRDQVQAFLDVVQSRQAETNPRQWAFRYEIRPLTDWFVSASSASVLWMLTVVMSLVLLIAAANLATLQLARTENRRHELAIRSTLGAKRSRLFGQLLLECLLLAGIGGAFGLLLTHFGLDLLSRFVALKLQPLAIDWNVLGISIIVTGLSGVLFGFTPAWTGGKTDVASAMSSGTRTASADRRQAWFTNGLVVSQVAIAMLLLCGAGLMIRSVSQLLSVDVGFDPTQVLRLYPPFDRGEISRRLSAEDGTRGANEYFVGVVSNLQRRFSGIPGVEAVGTARPWSRAELEASTSSADPSEYRVADYAVGVAEADPLQSMRARLLEGRWLTREDEASGGTQILLNQSAADMLWPGASAVGRDLWIGPPEQRERVEVVGVIADLRENGYDRNPVPTVYRPTVEATGMFGPSLAFLIRTSVHYSQLKSAFERELQAAGAGATQPRIAFLEEELYAGTAGHRTFMGYLLFAAASGLALSMIGLYGLVAYRATRRIKEMGIRLAIGAQRADVMRLVIRQGAVLVTIGVAIGLVGALLGGRTLQVFLFGVLPHDLLTLAGVAALLGVVGVIAAWFPARRAAYIDPMEALRTE